MHLMVSKCRSPDQPFPALRCLAVADPHRNLWHEAAYEGINTSWRSPETGQPVEVQFHTPESFDIKQRTHDLERARDKVEAITDRTGPPAMIVGGYISKTMGNRPRS